ncbi:hypothetical protein [Exiguobacterium sp. s138]|uniref:hypothetical protein n=1 Tax=Exiguobacterium sp. s138 TaxID=2751202 RepID=UPI001BE7FD79|nr:hypothetical protein [Exiguobacterium sp. s138]
MPLPFIVGGIAVAAGIGSRKKMKQARHIVEEAEKTYNRSKHSLSSTEEETSEQLATLEKLEVKIFKSFQRFSHAFEQIKGLPEFEQKAKDPFTLPEYSFNDFKKFETFQTDMHKKFLTMTMIPFIGGPLAFGSVLKELKDNSNLDKALRVQYEVDQIVASIDKSVKFLIRLEILAHKMELHLYMIHKIYRKQVYKLETLVAHNTDFNSYTHEERLLVDTNIKLVAVLHRLINQDLTRQEKDSEDLPVLLDDPANELMSQSQEAVMALNIVN